MTDGENEAQRDSRGRRGEPLRARRILVYGVTGSGKTTLAAEVARRTGLPWQCVDDLTWEPDWVPVAETEQRARISKICAGDEWILDTADSTWSEVVLARVELIIGLDYPRWLSLTRLVRRTVTRIVDRRPICNGNVESVRNAVSRDSILRWHFRSFTRKRTRMRQWAASGVHPRILLLRSPRQTRHWLATLPEPSARR